MGEKKNTEPGLDFTENDILAVRLSVFSVSPFPFRGALFRLYANARNLSDTLLLQCQKKKRPKSLVLAEKAV